MLRQNRCRSSSSAWLPIFPGRRQPLSWDTSCRGGVLAPVELTSPPGSRGPRTACSFLSRHPVVDGCSPELLSCVPSFRALCQKGAPLWGRARPCCLLDRQGLKPSPGGLVISSFSFMQLRVDEI
jgi:hypothetical protein